MANHRLDLTGIEPAIFDGIEARALELSQDTGRSVSNTAATRDLLRVGLANLKEAKSRGWDSGYREGAIVALRDIFSLVAVLRDALVSGTDPKEIKAAIQAFSKSE